MKRLLTAALLSSGLLFAAGAAPAFADPGDRGGGFRNDGPRGGRFDDAHDRRGGPGWGHRWGRRCEIERICWRTSWGIKKCGWERVCHPRWR